MLSAADGTAVSALTNTEPRFGEGARPRQVRQQLGRLPLRLRFYSGLLREDQAREHSSSLRSAYHRSDVHHY